MPSVRESARAGQVGIAKRARRSCRAKPWRKYLQKARGIQRGEMRISPRLKLQSGSVFY